MQVHIERVHLKVKQHCSFCEKKYSDVKNLLKHMEKRHNLKDPVVQQSYQQLRFDQNFLPLFHLTVFLYIFISNYHTSPSDLFISSRLKTRQGLRQLLYHCPTCNRRFKNQLERERHLLVHGSQRPFACLLCDHAATKMVALVAHVRKHLFLYVCCICDGKFVSSQRLKGHLAESHIDLDQEQAFADCINNSYYLMQPGGGMWGDDEREGMNEEVRIEQAGEDERTGEEEGRKGVRRVEWQDGEGQQMEVAVMDNREEKEEERDKAQGESAEEVQVIEGETAKEGELENRSVQQDSQELLHQSISMETTTLADRQHEAEAGEKSLDNMTDSCIPATEDNSPTFLSPESVHTPLLEDRTQENTHPADENTHAAKKISTSSSSGNTIVCDVTVNTHLSSAPKSDDGQTPDSERVN